jgi:hypothetical protein
MVDLPEKSDTVHRDFLMSTVNENTEVWPDEDYFSNPSVSSTARPKDCHGAVL